MVQKANSQKLIPLEVDGKRWDYFFYDAKTLIIQYERRLNGKKIKFSTGETKDNANKAKLVANRRLAEKLGTKRKFIRTLLSDELTAFEKFKLSEGHKYDTENNIRRAIKQMRPFWGGKLPSEINRDSFAEWCAWWRENNSEIEMENAVKYFNNFCRYLHEKVIGDHPLLPSVIRFRDPNRHEIEAERELRKERIFSLDEYNRVCEAAESEVERLIVQIMYLMGTRIDETLNLDFGGRIVLEGKHPKYRWTTGSNKAKKKGEHVLHSSLIEPLLALRARRKKEGTSLLFPQKLNNQKAMREQQIDWNAWRGRADLGWHWTPHVFRHTCLTNLFNDAKNPQAIICKLYRTSLQVALKHYIKVNEETMLAMRDAIQVIP